MAYYVWRIQIAGQEEHPQAGLEGVTQLSNLMYVASPTQS